MIERCRPKTERPQVETCGRTGLLAESGVLVGRLERESRPTGTICETTASNRHVSSVDFHFPEGFLRLDRRPIARRRKLLFRSDLQVDAVFAGARSEVRVDDHRNRMRRVTGLDFPSNGVRGDLLFPHPKGKEREWRPRHGVRATVTPFPKRSRLPDRHL